MTDTAPNLRQTPMLKQYFSVKRQYPHALLLFRMGDFFELFFEDAKVAARVLNIALTSRSKEAEIPMAGVPARAVDGYLRRLIQAGHTVVLCDQIEDPRLAKGLVDRAVTRIVTAGTVLEDALLDGARHNFLAALNLSPSRLDDPLAGLAWLDLSTARFEGCTVPLSRLAGELQRIRPAELVLAQSLREKLPAALRFLETRTSEGLGDWRPTLSVRPDHEFDARIAREALEQQLRTRDLRSFGLEPDEPLVAAAGAVIAYVRDTQRGLVEHVRRLTRWNDRGTMLLDPAAQQALELLETSRERRREGTLLWCIDRTLTAAGSRLLHDWVLSPLIELTPLRARQQCVAELFEQEAHRQELRAALQGIFDVERITARLSLGRASPRDLAQLRDSLSKVPKLQTAVAISSAPRLRELRQSLVLPPGLLELLEQSLVASPPLNLKDGGFIRNGYSPELDELRELRFNSKAVLAKLQQSEIERTNIPSLKVGFNSVFGYYLEITNTHRDKVPPEYVRKQTLKNAERYITPELKEHETKVLTAEERALALEQQIYEELRRQVSDRVEELLFLARAIAELDALTALAEAAREHGYVRPEVSDSLELFIEGGRHPVLQVTLGREAFVANDCRLGAGDPCVAIITGPNMAGKSTYLRQTALIVLLAQIGSFVPATCARIGLVDRIFTRVGASDDLVRGTSTFMVEMTETANILHHATERSLVILDEVGRGTGTFDGMSLARALAEYLAKIVGCRTLFATHYHQLTQLASELANVKNLSVAVREWGEDILFLHKIVPGGTDRSYGIHVARLAGVPNEVLGRATEILREMESQASKPSPPERTVSGPAMDRVLQSLARMDLEHVTPQRALQMLASLRAMVEDSGAPRPATRRKKVDDGPSLFEEAGSSR